MRTIISVLAIVCFTNVAFPAWSAAKGHNPSTLEEAQKQINFLEQKVKDLQAINNALNARLDQVGSISGNAEYRSAWIDYYKKLMERNIRMYTWQNEATQTIHKTTIVLVISALVISVAQIVFGMVFHRRKQGSSEQEKETLELSATRIKIATTVSGMILLLITFAFFYVYVQEVYAIKPPA